MKDHGPCVRVKDRDDGTCKFRFEVRRNLPPGWKGSTPILVNGRDSVVYADLTPRDEVEIRRTADELFRQLALARAANQNEPFPPAVVEERSWEKLIELRQAHSTWKELKLASKRSYASIQKRWILPLLASEPALAPSVVVESQIDRIFLARIHSKNRRKAADIEVRALINKAIREGWRTAGLTFKHAVRLDPPKMQIWTADEVFCFVTAAIQDGQRGLAKMIVAQWEIGQRLEDVRHFRYGQQYENGCLYYRCKKTGAEIRVDIVNKTARRILDDDYRCGEYMFPNRWGQPFTGPELSKAFRRIRSKIPDFDQTRQLRALRHTVVLELALSGCTIPEIASITGHHPETVHKTIEHYLPIHPQLAQNAVEKREERRRLDNVSGLSGELVVEGVRRILLTAPKAATPEGPEGKEPDGAQ